MFSLNSIPKKVFLLSLFALITLSSCGGDDDDDDTDASVFKVYKADNTEVDNNEIFTYNTLTEDAHLYLKVKNVSSNSINMRVKLVSMTNTDGTNMSVCVNTCVGSISLGDIWPSADTAVSIAAGATKDNITFLNTNPGTGTFPMDYKFSIYLVDDSGNNTGDSLTFTYRYQP